MWVVEVVLKRKKGIVISPLWNLFNYFKNTNKTISKRSFSRIFILLLVFLCLFIPSAYSVKLYEVYPNPITSEEYGEYINLFIDEETNIGNYIVETQAVI